MKAVLGVGVIGVACCTGGPALAALLAGAGAGALRSGAVGALALAAVAGGVTLIARRRRRAACIPHTKVGEP
jgi:hypothetical protein